MNEINYNLVGLKMKQLRTAQGVTQEQVANDLGCTIAFISNVENNRVKLNLRVLLYYSSLCHVPVDTFLNAGRTDLPEDADATALLEEWKQALSLYTIEEQRKMIKMLHMWKSED